ncbi:S-layer homology domain-containing protein [Fodinisporobacter ferrooxydans]|uniref:S-layer homology domain-containing protein n=1 Tax=Fodinisporobacter ferrooxydans TaxID=2901836 RepID=A0ABY4CH64_9BACL|nr:S-layer homology domain-containing protein [Alicyclobacillaceae bacterium MYW30-H2]
MNKNTLKGFIAGIALTTVVAGSGFAFADANGFVDVPNGQWYTQAVQWAKDHGIMVGTSATTFDPNKPMTRAEFAEAIKNLADHGYINVPSQSTTTGNGTGSTVTSDTYTQPATTVTTDTYTTPNN